MSTKQSISSTPSKKSYAGILQTPIAATPSAAQSVGISTREMSRKAAVNTAAASLRAAHIPTRPRKYFIASIAAAATALLANSSPSREETKSGKVDNKASPVKLKVDSKASPVKAKASPKKKEISAPAAASVMVISGASVEEQIQNLSSLLDKMMKENEEKNKKIDELQQEVVALRDKKTSSEHLYR